MRFALLGDHPDGLAMALALAESGRHGIPVYSGPPLGFDMLQRGGVQPRKVGDLEEILADPQIDGIIVASGVGLRPAQLRRALQSERHVLCVHPADQNSDIGYEAGMLQTDTGCVLLPLLPEALHPGIARLAELVRDAPATTTRRVQPGDPEYAHSVTLRIPVAASPSTKPRLSAPPRLIEWERWSTEELLLEGTHEAHKPGLPGWDILRLLGGEIAEIFLLAPAEELTVGLPLLLSGRFVEGCLLQATWLPNQAETRFRLSLVSSVDRATLEFPLGWPGPSTLTYLDHEGVRRVESFGDFHPWRAMVLLFEQAFDETKSRKPRPLPGSMENESVAKPGSRLGWQDELRALELDDAARRSVARHRSSILEFLEATEEASFKGTMTLVGCSLLWSSIVLLILSVWLPWLGWFIFPVFALFLGLQAFRWVVPPKQQESGPVEGPRNTTS